MFFGESPQHEYHITDFDATTFKLFLDCLMGFKPYTNLDSLLIFPIAHKFGTEESLKKCAEVLSPKVMNRNVCHTLNLALCYENQNLVENIINFIKENFNIVALLESEEYCPVLEPVAVAKLLDYVEMDFYLVKVIIKWGENYLRKSNRSVNIGTFLREHRIFIKMSAISFESEKSILDFCEFNETNNFFTSEQMLSILKSHISNNDTRKFPSDSSWVTIKKGDVLKENFAKPLYFIDIGNGRPLNIQIWRNEVVFMDTITESENPVACQINFSYFSSRKGNPLTSHKSCNYSFDESNIIKKGKKSIYEIKLPLSLAFFCLNAFEVTYTFNINCRILKTSLDTGVLEESKSLYHTYDITSNLTEVKTDSGNLASDQVMRCTLKSVHIDPPSETSTDLPQKIKESTPDLSPKKKNSPEFTGRIVSFPPEYSNRKRSPLKFTNERRSPSPNFSNRKKSPSPKFSGRKRNSPDFSRSERSFSPNFSLKSDESSPEYSRKRRGYSPKFSRRRRGPSPKFARRIKDYSDYSP